MEKTCSKCEARLPYSAFHKRRDGADGLYAYCKTCANAQSARYRQQNASDISVQRALYRDRNREEIAARSREWAARNPEYVRDNYKRFYEQNREKRRAYNAAWLKEHADEMRPYYAEKTRRRFAALRRAVPAWANKDAILALYRECRRISEETGVPHHVDHVVPLVSPLVCGLHVETNLQILTASDNLSKSNSFE